MFKVIQISNNLKKTEEINQYNRKSGKSAISKGSETELIKKWEKSQKAYKKIKKRVTIIVSEETLDKWEEFLEREKKFTTKSKLIREAVDVYIDFFSMVISKKSVSTFSHDLKEPLTSIKGLTYLLIESYRDKLNANILFILKDILDQSVILESIINDTLVNYEPKEKNYDILIVDDDEGTNKVLDKYFKLRGYSSKSVISGFKAMAELTHYTPKIILLDIILPKTNGYEICKKIKSNEKLRDVLIYYITAIPGNEVEEIMGETMADGYFLKPFNFPEFDILFSYLSKK